MGYTKSNDYFGLFLPKDYKCCKLHLYFESAFNSLFEYSSCKLCLILIQSTLFYT